MYPWIDKKQQIVRTHFEYFFFFFGMEGDRESEEMEMGREMEMVREMEMEMAREM